MIKEKETLIIQLEKEAGLLPIIFRKLSEYETIDIFKHETLGEAGHLQYIAMSRFGKIVLVGECNKDYKNFLTGYANAWYDILRKKE